MAKKIKYLHDGLYKDRYVRAFKEGRSEIIVQIWNIGRPQGEPDGDWALPAKLQLITCIEQALVQTPVLIPWEAMLADRQDFKRSEVVAMLTAFRERLAQIVDNTEPVGDYVMAGNEDGGSYWEESGSRSITAAAERIRCVEIPK